MRLNDAYQDDIDLIEDIARDFFSIKVGVVCEKWVWFPKKSRARYGLTNYDLLPTAMF